MSPIPKEGPREAVHPPHHPGRDEDLEGVLMAFNDYKHAWEAPGLTAAQRYVLLALAEHRNGEKDLCCPSYTTLAKETGLGIGTVCRSITKLGERGTISIHNDRKFRSNNRYTFSWNSSTVEETLPPGICNKEVNQELNKEGEQGTQQPVPRTGSAAVLHPTSKTEADRIARLFWELLGSPAHHKPERWSKPFSEILPLYPAPALEDILRFAFLAPRWKERLVGAKHPMAYLKSVLDHIEGDRSRYEAKRESSRPPKPAQ